MLYAMILDYTIKACASPCKILRKNIIFYDPAFSVLFFLYGGKYHSYAISFAFFPGKTLLHSLLTACSSVTHG